MKVQFFCHKGNDFCILLAILQYTCTSNVICDEKNLKQVLEIECGHVMWREPSVPLSVCHSFQKAEAQTVALIISISNHFYGSCTGGHSKCYIFCMLCWVNHVFNCVEFNQAQLGWLTELSSLLTMSSYENKMRWHPLSQYFKLSLENKCQWAKCVLLVWTFHYSNWIQIVIKQRNVSDIVS